jgi:hypothetical protein
MDTMRTAAPIVLALAMLAPSAGPAVAQDQPLELSGVASAGYSGSRDETRDGETSTPAIRLGEMELNLDLHTGTYILSPRFITVSADVRFSALRGKTGEEESSRGLNGQTYVVNVLPRSAFPFRLLYSREDAGYSHQQSSIFSSEHRSLRWDWQLRLASLPQVNVTYDSRSDASNTFTNPKQVSSHRGLSIAARDTIFGWEVNGTHDRRASEYEVTGLDTRIATNRFDALRSFSADSQLFFHASQQTMEFDPVAGVDGQEFSFLDVRTEYSKRFGQRFTVRGYQQLFASSVTSRDREPVAATGMFAPLPKSAPGAAGKADLSLGATEGLAGVSGVDANGLFGPLAVDAPDDTNGGVDAVAGDVSTVSSTFGGQASYDLFNSVVVSGGASVSFVDPPAGSVEAIDTLFETQANIAWSKRIGFISTRATASYGVASVRSTLETKRAAPFYAYGAGVTAGSASRVLVWLEGNHVYREDVLQEGGFSSDDAVTGGVEFQLFPSLRLTASAGLSAFDHVASQGRESFRRTMYSVGVEHPRVTFLYSQNSSLGDRDIYTVPFEVRAGALFVLLPVDTLIPDPLQHTRAIFGQALLRLRLVRNLDLEARYVRNESDFVRARDSVGRQFEVLAGYRLGKFTFRAGALMQDIAVEDSPARKRTQYFFRVSRAFRIF